MNKKNTVKKMIALLMGLGLTIGATGCNFIVTDTAKDYAQTIATVNISDKLAQNEEYKDSAKDVEALIAQVPSEITKRDLLSYFMSVGYQYVQSYGYSYEDTFNMLLDALVSREIMVQYAIAYYLDQGKGLTKDACLAYIGESEYPEIKILEYFLTEGGTDMEEYDRAVYNLKVSLNSSLDSMEASYIETEDEEHHHGSRTTPTGVGTQKEDYYTNDYNVYTGRNTLDSCGEYEKVEGSTTVTRQKAYNKFLANLQSYGLTKKGEDTKDITKLDYYYVELASSLEQSLINKYFEDLEDKALKELTSDYIETAYDDLYASQEDLYKNDVTSFATAMDSVSDTSFLLYGLEDFGFVYNILLPFSTSQSIQYKAEQNRGLSTTDLYNVRKDILANVKGEDLRSEWVDAHDHANHAYKAEDGNWYFFEDNKNTDKYEALDHYMNLIPFNGTIDEETMEATPNKDVTVDDVLDSFLDYAKTLGLTVNEDTAVKDKYNEVKTTYKDADGEIDYSNFMYRAGTIDVEADPAQYFNQESDLYKLLSYANELMFAYSTDTGCLNKYMGYSVSPYTTNYMKEFEYAAQWAVNHEQGPGSFAVAPTDYGWHIIITTFSYTADGDVYGGYVEADKDVEGTFSNLFYESLKSSVVNNYTTKIQNSVLKEYNVDACVTRYQSRYQDLLDMDNN